jgi:holo-[acyl-carrier protein] synthase
MIYGVGIDIVQVSRIERAINRWGARFLERIFTEGEIQYCRDKARSASRFALRFAAKEAFSKALGVGFTGGLRFRDIEVIRVPNERPCLSLHERARELWQSRDLKNSALSLSDDGLYATAVVVLEV